ncbi:MAG TPA: Na+/H+ antiporter NhaC family protein [Lactobacillaceae bacterium]|jgi:NhaC family Na+:H+ antiporter
MTKQTGMAISQLIVVIIILAVGVIGFGLMPVLPLLVSILVLVIWAVLQGNSFAVLQEHLLAGIRTGLAPIFLFVFIGALIGVWMGTNTIPTILFIGLKLANPAFFLPGAVLVSALVGSAIGSAFTTLATVGIVMMSIGQTMGFSPAIVAGAVLSGAIFGDKSSPLSDSTNLAAALSETDLLAHIKNLMWTTLPALGLSLVLFAGINWTMPIHATNTVAIHELTQALHPSMVALVPLLVLLALTWLKVPSIMTLLLTLAVSSVIFLFSHNVTTLADVMLNGFHSNTQQAALATLLNRGGIMSMMGTVVIIMLALAMGGLLTELGILKDALAPLTRHLHSEKSVIPATLLTGIGANFVIGEQYLATILPGQLFKNVFQRVNLSPLALGRTLEDGSTVINYLVPWGVAGSFAAQTLGVPVLSFVPFTFFALLSPVLSLVSAWSGIGLKKLSENVSA